MDHKLAIVIVPLGSTNPVEASRLLLEPFQLPRHSQLAEGFQPRFRYKRVGGWFDGLVHGEEGQQQWSSVLRVLYEGTATNAGHVRNGYRPETPAEIEQRIAVANVIGIDQMSHLAPCSIVVTPAGEWAEHGEPDDLELTPSSLSSPQAQVALDWAQRKEGIWREYRGFTAVAWDLSWYFVGTPSGPALVRKLKTWGFRQRLSPTSQEAWSARVSAARRTRYGPQVQGISAR